MNYGAVHNSLGISGYLERRFANNSCNDERVYAASIRILGEFFYSLSTDSATFLGRFRESMQLLSSTTTHRAVEIINFQPTIDTLETMLWPARIKVSVIWQY